MGPSSRSRPSNNHIGQRIIRPTYVVFLLCVLSVTVCVICGEPRHERTAFLHMQGHRLAPLFSLHRHTIFSS